MPRYPLFILTVLNSCRRRRLVSCRRTRMKPNARLRAVLQSPQWQAHEQELATVYRAVVRAWELGDKVPAVVFDYRDVVYGTADVGQAGGTACPVIGGQ